MDNRELEIGRRLQKALADVEHFNMKWARMELRGAFGAARKCIEKRNAAAKEVVQLRKALWALG